MTHPSNNTKKHTVTLYFTMAGLFAAVTAICSWISVPLPFTPVPLNLGTLAVFLTGGILGWKYGSVSIVVYVLLGAVGLPVFHAFTGGFSIIAGPTGGYIIGYIPAVFLIGLLISRFPKSNYIFTVLALTAGLFICYLLGTIWFMFLTKTNLAASLLMCVVPFLIGDAIKIFAAAILIKKLRPLLH